MKSFKQFLNKKTPSIEDIAKKYNKSIEDMQKQLENGISIEKEHTKNHGVATEIALDHLSENPNYYKKLKRYIEK
jgi:hypothetical protein